MAGSAVTDEKLSDVLGIYAGMVGRVLEDPQQWLGMDDDPPPSAGPIRKVLAELRDRTLGDITPASPEWAQLPLRHRTRWWIGRIGLGAGLAAAAPRFAGALADRIPLQAALGASAAGLAVCAVAWEHGRRDPQQWVPLLARVLFDRELSPTSGAVPDEAASQQELQAASEDKREPPSTMASLGRHTQRTVRALWRLARTFYDTQNLLDERPRGNFLARGIAKIPVVGLAGGWLDERGGIRKAAKQTQRLLGKA